MITNNWPPCYTVRKSKRAKKIILKISRQKGIECVIPVYANHYDAEQLLNKHRPWVEKQLQKIAAQNVLDCPQQLPNEILLRSVNQLWTINYLADTKRLRLASSATEQQLLIRGDIQNSAGFKLLKIWLKKQAKIILTPWLNELSFETNLSYNTLSIRGQTTLWGSCSSNKNINLNYKLLFLPKQLVENVMLHELCHTVHMDHSKNFWNLMQHYNNNALRYDREIKKTHKYIPAWVTN